MITISDGGLPLVDLLDAVRDHMEEHWLPEPYAVQAWSCVSGRRAPVSVHLAELRLSAVAGVLATWADTLIDASLSVWRPPSSDAVHVQVTGRLVGGVPIEVWAGVKDPMLVASLEPGQRETVNLGLLRIWITTPADDEERTADARAGGAA